MNRKCISGKLLKIGFAIALSLSVITPTALAKEKQTFSLADAQSLGEVVQTPRGPRFRLYDESMLQSKSMYYRSNQTLPEDYDLRNYGKVTPIRNQGVTGACWTFGTLAALESSMLVQGNANANDLDLSERQLAYFTFFGEDGSSDKSLYAGNDTFTWYKTWDDLYQEGPDYYARIGAILDANGINKDEFAMYSMGGNNYLSATTLARQYGATAESNAPYVTIGDNVGMMGAPKAEVRTMSDVRLDSVKYLPPVYDDQGVYQPLATEEIKRAIMTTGVVDVSYYADQSMQGQDGNGTYFNYTNWAQYVDLDYADARSLVNHEVSIVGWDDNFSRENFNENHRPEKDGAWIVKNSWGTGWGIEGSGYFYLSYYDKSICDPAVFIAENSTYGEHKYDNVYQYDGVGFGENLFTLGAEINAANIFTSRENELLEAVGVSAPVADINVKISVYTDWQGDNISSGTLQAQTTAKFSDSGYYTVPLNTTVNLPKGTKYAVVISMKVGAEYLLPVEVEIDGSYASIDYVPGQTFVSIGGLEATDAEWFDSMDLSADIGFGYFGNAMVKAFTTNTDEEEVIAPTLDAKTYDPTKTLKDYEAELNKDSKDGTWTWVDESIVPTVNVKTYDATFTSTKGTKTTVAVPLTIEKATPVINEQSTSSLLIYGDKLSNASINAKAEHAGQQVAGTFTWVDGNMLPEVKDKEAEVEFKPEDQINYNSVKGKIEIDVSKRNITITPDTVTIMEGDPIPTTFTYKITDGQLVHEDDVITVTLTTDATTESNPGTYAITGSATSANYNITVNAGKLIINEQIDVPVVEEQPYDPNKTLAAYEYIFNEYSDNGTWRWEDDSIVPNAGQDTYYAIYTSEKGIETRVAITIHIAKITPVIKDGSYGSDITYGDALAQSDIHAVVDGIEGTYSWVNDELVLPAGERTAQFIFTPKDTVNYNTVRGDAVIQVAKRKLTITPVKVELFTGSDIPTSFTYTLTEGSLVGNDTITIVWSTTAKKDSPAGSYEINGTVTSENYEVTVVKGTLVLKDKEPDPTPTPTPTPTPEPQPTPDEKPSEDGKGDDAMKDTAKATTTVNTTGIYVLGGLLIAAFGLRKYMSSKKARKH